MPNDARQHTQYYVEIGRADEDLQEALGHVQAETDAGRLSTKEAADERILLLERHLERCQALRRQYLGGETQHDARCRADEGGTTP